MQRKIPGQHRNCSYLLLPHQIELSVITPDDNRPDARCAVLTPKKWLLSKYIGSIADLASEAYYGFTNVPRHECTEVFEQYAIHASARCARTAIDCSATFRYL